MRKKIVAGNWKLNNTMDEGLKLTSEIVNMINDPISGVGLALWRYNDYFWQTW